MTDRAVELALERERLAALVEEAKFTPEERQAQVEAELHHLHAEEERKDAERQARIETLLAVYEPAARRADNLTVELADALEAASAARSRLKELRAAPPGIHERAARRDPTDMSLAPIGEARLRLRRALALEY